MVIGWGSQESSKAKNGETPELTFPYFETAGRGHVSVMKVFLPSS